MEQHEQTPRQRYWQRYGLAQAPFSQASSYSASLQLPQWKRYLEQLNYFAMGAEPLLVVQGVIGSGKSLLQAEFITQVTEAVDVQCVDASPHVDLPWLSEKLAQAFGASSQSADPSQDHFSRLVNQVNALSARERHCVLMVDDAHGLPTATLSAMLVLAAQQVNSTCRLHIVLFAESRIEQQIKTAMRREQLELTYKTIELAPLCQKDIKAYLLHRLTAAGFSGKLPFTDRMIEHIAELSGGVPGRINRVAQQTLINALNQEKETNRATGRFGSMGEPRTSGGGLLARHRVRLVSLLGVTLLMAGMWEFSGHLSGRLQVAQHQRYLVAMQKVSGKQENAEHNTIAEKRSDVTGQPEAGASLLAVSPPPAAPVVPVVRVSKAVAADFVDQTFARLLAQATIQAPTPHASMAGGQTQALASLQTGLTPDERALMKETGYTIQLAGLRTAPQAKRFITQHHLTGSQIKQFHTQFEGKPWHVVVYGEFHRYQDAWQAMMHLSPHLKAGHPWIRPLRSVHLALR